MSNNNGTTWPIWFLLALVLLMSLSTDKSSTALTASSTTLKEGEMVTLKATVWPGSAKGTVVFYEANEVELETAEVTSGLAVLQTNKLSTGLHSIRARYSGDGNCEPSVSQEIYVTVVASNHDQK